jgi:allantoin racemase
MPRYLLINPNTSQETTTKLYALFSSNFPDVTFDVVTARFGATYISCESSYAVATHACLDAWKAFEARQTQPIDGVLIACFGDPGLFALRDICHYPVTGLAESSFIKASAMGAFSIVTGGHRWKPMLERLIGNLGYKSALTKIVTVDASGAILQSNPALAKEILSQACFEAQGQGAKSIILGGAGLAGYSAGLQSQCTLPLIDSALAGIDILLMQKAAATPSHAHSHQPIWTGLPKYFSG